MMQVEIFQTDVQKKNQADALIRHLVKFFPDYCINFDLDDCDRILRVEAGHGEVNNTAIIQLMHSRGFTCVHLT